MAKILLVEDNEMNRDMLTRRLKRRGFDLCEAMNGQEGVDSAKSEKPDLILMDMRMPILNGWDATKQIKSDPDTKDIPIIGLSAHAMEGDRERALEVGCDEYDTKPVDFERLTTKIATFIN